MNDSGRKYRFFAGDLSGDSVALEAGEAHHALHVLRVRTGDVIELFDGDGVGALGRVAQAGRGGVLVNIESRLPPKPRQGPIIHLAFAVPKGKRLDWLLEKATELAAASLTPVVFERSVAGGDELSQAKRERWLAHCIAAAKQSGQDFLPQIRPAVPLTDFATAADGGCVKLLGDVGDTARPLAVVLRETLPQTPQVVVLVGPEGGLTTAEKQQCIAGGFASVRLGWTTLRIETAAVSLLAAVIAAFSNQPEQPEQR